MDDAWNSPPTDLDKRIHKYTKQAAGLGVRPDLIKKCARIAIAAQHIAHYQAQQEQETRDDMARVAAFEHGVIEEDPHKARAAYAKARQRHQAIHNSARGLANRIKKFEDLLKPGYRSMSGTLREKFTLAEIVAACDLLNRFAVESTPHPNNLAEVKFAKSELHGSAAERTFLWWRYYLRDPRPTWQEMFELSRRWNLTEARDISDFRRRVRKAKPVKTQVGTFILPCPPWALQ
jgi:hypothetical protein